MTKLSTALLTVDPKTISPWGDRLWRVELYAELVSANSGDYWIVTKMEPAPYLVSPSEVTIERPESSSVIERIV